MSIDPIDDWYDGFWVELAGVTEDGKLLERTHVEGLELYGVHSPNNCIGKHPCVIHNPTAHHMRKFKLIWRDDRGLFERICPHGIGHPDPDQYEFWNKVGMSYMGVHGCDGCCR